LIELGPVQAYQSIEWLLSWRDGTRVTAVGAPHHGDVVQLEPPARVAGFSTQEGSWPAHAEDSDQLVLPKGSVLSRPDMARIEDPDGFEDIGGATKLVRALIPRADSYLMLVQRPLTRTTRTDLAIANRGSWQPLSYPPWSWRRPMPLAKAQLSPALSDDTLIVCLQDKLVYLSAQGTGVVDPNVGIADAKVIAEVQAGLMPDLVSVDLQDRVWGFHASDRALVGWNARGESLGAPLPLDVTPVQPPVALPDGALAIIAPGTALKVKDGAIVWRTPLPEGAAPLATADGQGTLVIRVERELIVLDTHGKKTWFASLPAVITSNPLITTTGRVCVATGLVLRCSK
jgi:hypothetical protein